MRTPDEVPDRGGEHVQGETGDALVGADIIPGYVLPTDPPTSTPGFGDIVANLDHAADTAEHIGGLIAGSLADELGAATETATAIEAQIRGSIGEHLDGAQATVEKVAAKIDGSIQGALQDAYSTAYALGYEYPSVQEMATDEAMDQPAPVGARGPIPAGAEVYSAGGAAGTPACPGWGPPILLPVFPVDEPQSGGGTAWSVSGGSQPCYKWQLSTVWVCDRTNGAAFPYYVGHLPNTILWSNPSGLLTWGLAVEPGAVPLQPTETLTMPGVGNCPEPQEPTPPETVPGGGGGGGVCGWQGEVFCVDTKNLNQAATPMTVPLMHPTGNIPVMALSPDGPITPGWCRVEVTTCPGPEAGAGPGSAFGLMPAPIGNPYLDENGLLWFVHNAAAPGNWCRVLGYHLKCFEGGTEPQVPPTPPGAVCLPDPGPICPPAELEIPPLQLGAGDDCGRIQAEVARWTDTPIDHRSIVGADTGLDTTAGTERPSWWGLLTGRKGPVLSGLINRMSDWMKKKIVQTSKSVPCNDPGLMQVALVSGLFKFINQWFGIIPRAYMVQLQQAENFTCQVNLPSGAQADSAYIADTITKETWECFHRAEGNSLRPADSIMQAARNRPNAMMLVLLHRRNALKKEDYEALMRKEGFINPADRDRFFEGTKSWPALDDVIRMMVREATDEGIAKRFHTDEGFPEVSGSNLMKYADGLGIDKELLRLYWRAHWRIPSYTQLAEMYHRYRYEDTPEELRTTLDDVRTAIRQDDVLPWWIDRMVGISHTPLTRIDSQRGYQLHVMDDDQLKRSFQVRGYSDADADMMVAIAKAKRDAQEAQQSGLPTARTMINQFAKGVLSEWELRKQLEAIGRKEERLERAIESARIARSVRARDLASAAVQRAYFAGLLSESEADTELGKVGIDVDAKAELLAVWRVQRAARGKMAAAQTLCKWRGKALITAEQQAVALTRLGWREDDVKRIVYTCESDLAEAMSEKAYRDLWRARREAEYAEKQAKKKSPITVPVLTPSGG